MKRFRKKALALFLTAMMVAAMAPMALAGSFSDVPAGADYAGSVERLAGLAIVNGMGDGTYAPEGQFTRGQAAAIAVRLRGINSAGPAPTEFSDVSANHWASGWINMATGLGIIKGMGDGTFAPDAPVTHAQWLTMVLRTMGYGPVVDNKPWPAGVLAQAALLDLDAGVNVIANLPASRAEVAVIADNALTANLMVVSGIDANGKETYSQSDTKTVANTYLKAKIGEGTLTDSPDLFANNGKTVVFAAALDLNGDGDTSDTGEGTTYTLDGGNASSLIGHKVAVWVNSAGKVFYAQGKTASSNVITGTVKSNLGATTGTTLVEGIEVGSKYDLAASWALYLNGAKINNAVALNADALKGAEGYLVLNDDGDVTYVVLNQYATDAAKTVDTVNNRLVMYGSTLNFKDATVNVSGAATKLSEIKAGDIIQYYTKNSDVDAGNVRPAQGAITATEFNLVVTRNQVSGKVNSVASAGTAVTDKTLKLSGGDYGVNSAIMNDSGTAQNAAAVEAMAGKTVTLSLDKGGKVVVVATASVTSLYGGVTQNSWADSAATITYLKVLKTDGNKTTYTVADGAKVYKHVVAADTQIKATDGTDGTTATTAGTAIGAAAISVGDVIKYELNSSGEINKVTRMLDFNHVAGAVGSATNLVYVGSAADSVASDDLDANVTVDKDNHTINVQIGDNVATLALLNGTIIIDVYGVTTDGVNHDTAPVNATKLTADLKFVTQSDLEGVATPAKAFMEAKDGVAKLVAVKHSAALTSSANRGIVTSQTFDGTDRFITVLSGSGSSNTYKGDAKYLAQDVIVYTVSGNTLTASTHYSDNGHDSSTKEYEDGKTVTIVSVSGSIVTVRWYDTGTPKDKQVIIGKDTALFSIAGSSPTHLTGLTPGSEVLVYGVTSSNLTTEVATAIVQK